MKFQEKRRSQRQMFVRTLNMTTMSAVDNCLTEICGIAEAVNISEGGIMIWTRGLPPGKDSIVKLHLMISGLLVSVPVLMTVKWFYENSPGIYRTGLQFIGGKGFQEMNT